VNVSGAPSTFSFEKTLYVQLNGTTDKTINVKRYEMNVQSGTKNTFCWAICPVSEYAGVRVTMTSPFPVDLVPGFETDQFKAAHEPEGISGDNTYLFVWYDVANPNDSAWVEVIFNVQPLTVAEYKVNDLNAYQVNNAILVHSVTAAAGAYVQIFDAIGQLVTTQKLEQGNAKSYVPMDGFASGVYFVTLNHANQRLVSRKVFYNAN
jgi:hypothetical protein